MGNQSVDITDQQEHAHRYQGNVVYLFGDLYEARLIEDLGYGGNRDQGPERVKVKCPLDISP